MSSSEVILEFGLIIDKTASNKFSLSFSTLTSNDMMPKITVDWIKL